MENRQKLIDKIEALRAKGISAKEACDKVGVLTATYYTWKNRDKKKITKVQVFEGNTPKRRYVKKQKTTNKIIAVMGTPEEVAAFLGSMNNE